MKTALIPDANSGIGKATPIKLAAGGCHTVFTSRNLQWAEAFKKIIISSSRNTNVDFIGGDLLSLTQRIQNFLGIRVCNFRD